MEEVFVVVHLSSIDSYVNFYGVDAAQNMMNDIRIAIMKHRGPIVILDQEWDEISYDAKVLRQMVIAMQTIYPITLLHHDELTDISPWQDGMKKLASLLRKLKAYRVRLGGFWTSQNGRTGCVHEVQRQLRARNFACYIDADICALEENDRRGNSSQ